MLLSWNAFYVAGLRGITLLSKFLFTIILARILPVVEFGQWVLILAVVTYAVFLIGAEFYNLTLRAYISRGYVAVIPQFSAQWTFFFSIYALVLSVGLAISLIGEAQNASLALIVAVIVVLEHLTQELHRVAVFEDRQIPANIILLLKTAGWMVPVGIYLMWSGAEARLAMVLEVWVIGAMVSAVYALLTYNKIFSGLRLHFAFQFKGRMLEVIRRLTPFLILSFALRTPLLLDRYFIELYADRSQLATYGYYVTFGNGVQAIFEAVVLARLIPELLRLGQDIKGHIRAILRYTYIAIGFWFASFAVLYFLVPYFNAFVGKDNFRASADLLFFLFSGQLLFSLGVIVQFGLYAQHRDKQMVSGALLYLAASSVLFLFLVPAYGQYGAAASLAVGAAAMLTLRWWQLLRPA